MFAPRWILLVCGIAALNFGGTLAGQTEQGAARPPDAEAQAKFAEPDCPFFGADRERYFTDALRRKSGMAPVRRLSATTNAVGKMLGFVPGGSRTYNFDQAHAAGSIDSYIFADFQANGINPAPKTTDWEFIRRVTLDLTGRIPAPDRVLSFVADTAPDKRAKLIEELLAKPEWIDKWTMYFGDLYQNTDNKPSTALRRFPTGRNAFYGWIKDSLSKGKPYNQMATRVDRRHGDEYIRRRAFEFPGGRGGHDGPDAGHHGPDGGEHVRHVPGDDACQLPAVPQRARAPGRGEPVGDADHPLPGVAACVLHVADQHGADAGATRATTTSITGPCWITRRTSPRITR